MELSSKSAIITGSSTGIGAATAEYFVEMGCQVTLCGRNAEALNESYQRCCAKAVSSEQVLEVQVDLVDDAQQQRLIDAHVTRFGKLDVLVNNAGIQLPMKDFLVTDVGELDRTLDVNVRAIFSLTQKCAPLLAKTKGCVVNVSSMLSTIAIPAYLPYCMSKAALDSFTRNTAVRLAKDGVRVNSVNPGVVPSDLKIRHGMSEQDYAKFLEHAKNKHPLGRVGTGRDIAMAIAFLASDKAAFITGVVLPVDGGMGICGPWN